METKMNAQHIEARMRELLMDEATVKLVESAYIAAAPLFQLPMVTFTDWQEPSSQAGRILAKVLLHSEAYLDQCSDELMEEDWEASFVFGVRMWCIDAWLARQFPAYPALVVIGSEVAVCQIPDFVQRILTLKTPEEVLIFLNEVKGVFEVMIRRVDETPLNV